jgi:hypothetical protein
MDAHAWLIVALILFIVAGVLAIVQPTTTAPRWLQAFTVQCAGLACLTAAFLVAK